MKWRNPVDSQYLVRDETEFGVSQPLADCIKYHLLVRGDVVAFVCCQGRR